MNGTRLQFFEWYYPADGSLWNEYMRAAEHRMYLFDAPLQARFYGSF
jgi:hypothetical protein